MAYAMEPIGKHVQQEPAHELANGEPHDLVLVVAILTVVLPAKADLLVREFKQPAVADGDAVSVPRKIGQDLLWACERTLGVNNPFPRTQGSEVGLECLQVVPSSATISLRIWCGIDLCLRFNKLRSAVVQRTHMRLRLIRPSLKYFNSFLRKVHDPEMPALEYLAQVRAQEGEREYWLVDDERCYGSVLIRYQPKGRKVVIATHIDLTSSDLSTQSALIKLAVRKAWKLGINPVRMTCDATDFAGRENMERSGGELVDIVRERVPAHSGKVRMYSFSAPLPSELQGVLGNVGELGENLSRGSEPQSLPGPTVETI
jgi:predicted acetyltransferase